MNLDPILRLKWHAGLQEGYSESIPSIAQCTWLPNNQLGLLKEAGADLMLLLNRLNHYLNGSKPSENTAKPEGISREIIFAVEEIRRLLGEAAIKSDVVQQQAILRVARSVAYAWAGIVAGDIDDLLEYVSQQELAKG